MYIAELTNCSEEVHRSFFYLFCKIFSEKLYSTYIKGPGSTEDINDVIDVYRRMAKIKNKFKSKVIFLILASFQIDCLKHHFFNTIARTFFVSIETIL
jgi:hypothetical protein